MYPSGDLHFQVDLVWFRRHRRPENEIAIMVVAIAELTELRVMTAAVVILVQTHRIQCESVTGTFVHQAVARKGIHLHSSSTGRPSRR